MINRFASAAPRFLPYQDLWQFELTRPHNGNWSRISAFDPFMSQFYRTPFYVTNDWRSGQSTQWNLPKYVSADSEGVARIISPDFAIDDTGIIVLR